MAERLVERASTLLFPEHNSTTLRNILKELGTVIEQVNTECNVQDY